MPDRGPVKDRLGPLPKRKLRPAERAGEEAAKKRNAANPGKKEQVEAAWRKKREEEKERERMKAQEDLFWSRARPEDIVMETESTERKEEEGTKKGKERDVERERESDDGLEDDVTFAKKVAQRKDKFPQYRKKVFFGDPENSPQAELIRYMMRESVAKRERHIKDDSICPGLFREEIEKENRRIEILREGRDPDSPVEEEDECD